MTLAVVRLRSRRAQRLLSRLRRRGRTGVDRRTLSQARRIVRGVRRGGEKALLDYALRFDGVEAASVDDLRLEAKIDSARREVGAAVQESLEVAIQAVQRFHRAQAEHVRLAEGFRLEADGVRLEERHLPLARVGIYVPGGRFPYPSTVIMAVVPARIAGVEEIVVVTPPRAFAESAELRYTLARLGVDEVWGLGGAHAVAGLAYGAGSLRPVDLIAGPGNVWVAAAKQLVAGDVGVDREAGPSEVVIVASDDAPAPLIAADLLAQAEHDPRALAVLVTPSVPLARAVRKQVAQQLAVLGTAEVAEQALRASGAAFVVEDLEQAVDLAEELAPEHLQLMGGAAEELASQVRCAGAVFVGSSTPVVFGDYLAGPSHVLPTAGTARFASGLGVGDFVRRCHTVRFSPPAAAERAADAARLARVEGLMAHAEAARRRSLEGGE